MASLSSPASPLSTPSGILSHPHPIAPHSSPPTTPLCDLYESPVDEGDVGEEEGGRTGIEAAVRKDPGQGLDLEGT